MHNICTFIYIYIYIYIYICVYTCISPHSTYIHDCSICYAAEFPAQAFSLAHNFLIVGSSTRSFCSVVVRSTVLGRRSTDEHWCRSPARWATPSQSPSTSRHFKNDGPSEPRWRQTPSASVTRAERSPGPSTSSTARASAHLRAPANGDELRAHPARAPSARLGSADAPTPPSTGSWRACRAIPPRRAEDARLQPARGPRAVHPAGRHVRALPRRGAGPVPTRLPGRGERPPLSGMLKKEQQLLPSSVHRRSDV
jgi:hypothetical protein